MPALAEGAVDLTRVAGVGHVGQPERAQARDGQTRVDTCWGRGSIIEGFTLLYIIINNKEHI